MSSLAESIEQQYDDTRESITDLLDHGQILDAMIDHMMCFALAMAISETEDASPEWNDRASTHYRLGCDLRLRIKDQLAA